jgi:aminopeptidase YwaD
MKYILAAALLVSQSISAQQVSKDDEKIQQGLRKSINYLADDKLEGRRTGTPGEKLAYEYIQNEFKNAGLAPFAGDKTYLQPFGVNDGRQIGKETSLSLGGKVLELKKDFTPYPFSANVKNFSFNGKDERVAYYELSRIVEENKDNPHFDLKENIIDAAKKAAAGGRIIFIVQDASAKEDFVFDAKDKTETLSIPVIFMKAQPEGGAVAFATAPTAPPPSSLTIQIESKQRTGHNVIGYIDNGAKNTIILGAHYDHLGYGEDHNSLYAGAAPMIHNGADDNASGTAALIELGKWLKKSGYKNNNYLFVSFSGEELGLYGSKYFTDHPGIDLKTVDYMINMDMIGRLNDSTHGLTIGGYGTSPTWGKIINTKDSYFKINTDSSGSGPSDHTSFYKKDIPVLFFFTGSHKDYHKPSDDADKINFAGELQVIHYIQSIIAQTDKMDKLVFTKTREVSMGKSSFKVSLGIMPDYTYSEPGVRVDGVSDNKPAQKAGILTGDVLIQLGDYKFTDVESYMGALNKFNKGESTNVKLKRGKEEITLPITF